MPNNATSTNRGGAVRFQTKAEIAADYGVTSKYFWRMVHRNEQLMQRLEACGYARRQKMLTSRQAHIVREHYQIFD